MKKALIPNLFITLLILAIIGTSCSPMKSTTTAKEEKDNTIYFKAGDSVPFWRVTISEKEVVLTTKQNTLVFPHEEPIRAMDSNVKRYQLRSDDADMSVTIAQEECTNPISGEKLPYSVVLKYKIFTELPVNNLSGCGAYITDYRLNDIWVLETLNGIKAEVASFRDKLPTLEINTETNSFSGFAGCNSMAGELFYERGLVRFSKTITTMIYCENNKEKEFLSALHKATTYKIENNRLTLSNPSGILMVLKKVD